MVYKRAMNIIERFLHPELTSVADELYQEGDYALDDISMGSSSTWRGKTWREILSQYKRSSYFAVSRGIFPIGEWSEPLQHGQTVKRYRDAARLCRLLRPHRVGGTLYAGDFCRISHSYYTEVLEEHCGPGDYCHYCGAFNGPNGEERHGWDCGYCGCN